MDTRILRVLIGIPLLASVALLSPASATTPARCAPAQHAGMPTPLDYVVLASFSDSSSLLSMSTYNIRALNR
jgi:hypothetical protein